jgi:hypothetical protein
VGGWVGPQHVRVVEVLEAAFEVVRLFVVRDVSSA